jgi:hypothetical protein
MGVAALLYIPLVALMRKPKAKVDMSHVEVGG